MFHCYSTHILPAGLTDRSESGRSDASGDQRSSGVGSSSGVLCPNKVVTSVSFYNLLVLEAAVVFSVLTR